MSLRVLLADESASIRKVFQMGLQDFGAEVKSVHNGLDVIEVAENYKPNIIFADILLQKKNGYEVSQEIIQHENLSQVPVVLMWSSFMELDQNKYKSCGAQGELEKPFDVENMRNLIQSLVDTTRSQKISEFLNFPDSITRDFKEEEESKQNQQQSADLEIEDDSPELALEEDGESPEEHSVFNIQAEDSNFDMYEVPQVPPPPPPKEDVIEPSNEEMWESKPLNDHSIEKKTSTEADSDLDQFQTMELGHEEKLNLEDFLYQPDTGVTPPPDKPDKTDFAEHQIQNVHVPQYDDTRASANAVSPTEIEAIVRAETRAALSSVIRDQLPTLLEKVVREELEKVMEQEMALKGMGRNP